MAGHSEKNWMCRKYYKNSRYANGKMPVASIVILTVILAGCVLADVICKKDPSYLDLMNYSKAPNAEFWFGTDTLGRDIFSCVWHGGRVSLAIGALATLLSVVIAVIYGTISGMAADWIDTLLMRFTEIILSVPTLLLIIFLQAILGEATVLSVALVIGLTSWCQIAKIVRTEVRQLRSSEYVLAAKALGGGFWHILRKHLVPNFVSSIMFMVVMNIRSAIVAESTLSFLGIGFPLEIISWGSMLSLAQNAFLSGGWWMIVIPGIFLILVLMSVTNIGHWIQVKLNHRHSRL